MNNFSSLRIDLFLFRKKEGKKDREILDSNVQQYYSNNYEKDDGYATTLH